MRRNCWARVAPAGLAVLLVAGACSPKAAVTVTTAEASSSAPMRDFDLSTTTTTTTTGPPTTAPAVTAMFHGKPSRASRSAVRTRPSPPHTAQRSGDCGGWRDLVAGFSWPVDQACGVLVCESRGDPEARNRHSSAAGLFQVLGGPLDPAANAARAFAMWSSRGWAPWVASRSCWA